MNDSSFRINDRRYDWTSMNDIMAFVVDCVSLNGSLKVYEMIVVVGSIVDDHLVQEFRLLDPILLLAIVDVLVIYCH